MSFFSQTTYSKVESSFYEPIYGNYKFDVNLTEFAILKELKIRKVNRLGSLLKLREMRDVNSIYPMIDEFGYTFTDFFIFKSSWDINYHIETILPIKDKIEIKDKYITRTNIVGRPQLPPTYEI